jgi:hypothetical protein
MKKYFWNLLISIDQFGNALIGGNPDETISSHSGRRLTTCVLCRWLCWCLNWFEKDHCQKSLGS